MTASLHVSPWQYSIISQSFLGSLVPHHLNYNPQISIPVTTETLYWRLSNCKFPQFSRSPLDWSSRCGIVANIISQSFLGSLVPHHLNYNPQISIPVTTETLYWRLSNCKFPQFSRSPLDWSSRCGIVANIISQSFLGSLVPHHLNYNPQISIPVTTETLYWRLSNCKFPQFSRSPLDWSSRCGIVANIISQSFLGSLVPHHLNYNTQISIPVTTETLYWRLSNCKFPQFSRSPLDWSSRCGIVANIISQSFLGSLSPHHLNYNPQISIPVTTETLYWRLSNCKFPQFSRSPLDWSSRCGIVANIISQSFLGSLVPHHLNHNPQISIPVTTETLYWRLSNCKFPQFSRCPLDWSSRCGIVANIISQSFLGSLVPHYLNHNPQISIPVTTETLYWRLSNCKFPQFSRSPLDWSSRCGIVANIISQSFLGSLVPHHLNYNPQISIPVTTETLYWRLSNCKFPQFSRSPLDWSSRCGIVANIISQSFLGSLVPHHLNHNPQISIPVTTETLYWRLSNCKFPQFSRSPLDWSSRCGIVANIISQSFLGSLVPHYLNHNPQISIPVTTETLYWRLSNCKFPQFSRSPLDWSSRCGIVANILDCGVEVSEFKLPSRYYVCFCTNTRRKVINQLVPLIMD